MGSASSSSAATSAIDSTGGNITVNPPNYVMWAVIGIAVIAGLWFFLGRKR